MQSKKEIIIDKTFLKARKRRIADWRNIMVENPQIRQSIENRSEEAPVFINVTILSFGSISRRLLICQLANWWKNWLVTALTT